MVSILGRKLLRDLWARWPGLFALCLVSSLGVALFIATNGAHSSLVRARQRYFAAQRLADIFARVERAPESALGRIRAQPFVLEARSRLRVPILVELGQGALVSGEALSLPGRRGPILNDVRLSGGSWFSNPSAAEVILDRAFARARGLRPGQYLQLRLGEQSKRLLIVGLGMSPEFVYLLPPGGGLVPDPASTAVVYLPRRWLAQTLGLEGAFHELLVRSRGISARIARARLETLLEPYGVRRSGEVRKEAAIRFLSEELKGLAISSRVIPAIFLLVSALLLQILLRRLVVQQRREFGTLRALGYGRRRLVMQALGFGLAVGLGTAFLGLGLGLVMLQGMLQVYRGLFAMPGIVAHLNPEPALVGLSFSLGFALLGSVRAALDVGRLDVAIAMRSPAPAAGGRIFLEGFPRLWKQLPISWRRALRTVLRSRFRSAVGVLASCFATAMIVVTVCNQDALTEIMDQQFKRRQKQDLSVTLNQPQQLSAAREILRSEGVQCGEAQLLLPCRLRAGGRTRRVVITGLTEEHRLQAPVDAAGRRVPVAEGGLVLSRKLAELMGVGVGGRVQVRALTGRRRSLWLPVTALSREYLGLSVYARISTLSLLLGESLVANSVALRVESGRVRGLMRSLRRLAGVVGVDERIQALRSLEASFGETMMVMNVLIIAIAGAMAFGSVLNMALVSLGERRAEVGTLRAIGYSPGQIARGFALEASLVSGLGIALGLGLGIFGSHQIARAYDNELYRFPAVVHGGRLLLAAALVAGFVGAAQIAIFRLIASMRWLDALEVKE